MTAVWCATVTMHVLFVLLVAGVSMKVKDATPLRSTSPQQQGLANTAFDRLEPRNTTSKAMPQWLNGEDPCRGLPERIERDYSVCGEGKCRCRDTLADCSNSHLTYIPQLPATITRLSFSMNELRTIPHDDFFLNVTRISSLNLSINNLSYISSGALSFLKRLRVLRLAANNLTYATLSPVLSVTTLQVLVLSYNPLGSPPDGIFDKYRLPYLEVLCLNGNSMASLNMTVFKDLPKLRYLQLMDNHLSRQSLHTDYLPQLTEALFLSDNSFNSLPQTCGSNKTSLFPRLTLLDLQHNSVYRTTNVPICLPALQYFSLVDNNLITISKHSFSHSRFPALKILRLEGNSKIKTIEKYAFRNPCLEHIKMDGCGINFAADSVDTGSFAGCPNLRFLQLDNNDFSGVNVDKFNRMFRDVSNLAGLSLTSANIHRLSADMFANLHDLRDLWLDSNKLSELSDGVFDVLPNLIVLGLSANRLASVREATFSTETRHRLKRLNLGSNPLFCSCELRWFQQWLTSQPALFDDEVPGHTQNAFTCVNLPNTTVQSFYLSDQACLWSPGVSKYIIATIVILMLPLALGTALYRYRWHIRLVLYEAYRGRGDRWRRLQEQHFRYDVFVSYDKEDLNWVQGHLMPELEDKMGLRLCIHQRDFILGNPIVENITESVQASKKAMLIFSGGFSRSEWCQFELQLCLSHVMENDDALLVVLLEDIPSRDLTPAMMAVMKTMTYIEWEDEPEARASFWGRIRLTLDEILTTFV